MHEKGRDCARTEEVLENYRRRAVAAELELVRYKAPCADLRCKAHATGDFRDCECGGWERYARRRAVAAELELVRCRHGYIIDEPRECPDNQERSN